MWPQVDLSSPFGESDYPAPLLALLGRELTAMPHQSHLEPPPAAIINTRALTILASSTTAQAAPANTTSVLEISLVAVVVLLTLILLSLWTLLYQLLKQQGRLVLRLDEVERRSTRPAQTAGVAVQNPVQPLPLGTAIPPFQLPNVRGHLIGLEAFQGQKVLLINWNPRCGFCDLIAPELARLQSDFSSRNVQLVLIADGDAGIELEARTGARSHMPDSIEDCAW